MPGFFITWNENEKIFPRTFHNNVSCHIIPLIKITNAGYNNIFITEFTANHSICTFTKIIDK